jgi:hypothetical protein
MDQSLRVFFREAPLWFDAAWAISVWSIVAAAVLLLIRSRHAVVAFGVSLIGFMVSAIWPIAKASGLMQGLLPPTPSILLMTIVSLIGAIVGLSFLAYARAMRRRGVLR